MAQYANMGGRPIITYETTDGVELLGVAGGSSVSDGSNTTTTALSGSATYTGTAELNAYPDVGVSCITDAAGTLYFDFSVDGTNWNVFPVAGFAITAGVHEFHTAVKLGRYFRVRLVNGADAQSYLRLYTYFGAFRQGNAPLNSTIAADSDAIIVRSVPTDLDLALGRFSGLSEDAKFGFVTNLDALDNACDVWAFANDALATRSDTKTFPTSAQSLYICSDSASDTDVDVTVYYLDAAGDAQSVTPNLNGQTSVDVGVTALDCNRLVVTGATAAVGNIYLTIADDFAAGGTPNDVTDVLAFIPAGLGQTEQVTYTVPAGYSVRVKWIHITVARGSGSLGSAVVDLRVRESGKTWVTKRRWHLQTGEFMEDTAGLIVPALSNFTLRVDDVSDTDTNVTAVVIFDLVAV